MIAVYTITSGLHDEAAVSQLSDAFLTFRVWKYPKNS